MKATIVGSITRERFGRICEAVDFGYGPNVAVRQTALLPIGRTFEVADAVVAAFAADRNRHKRQNQVSDRKVDARASSVAIDVDGLCAEFAVALWLNQRPDLDLYAGADRGFDLMAADGRTIDVKATRHANGRLLFQTLAKFRADVATLVVIR